MVVSEKKKNDKAWNAIFEKNNILSEINEKGFYIISSKEINVYREARLMAKFDHRKSLPQVFLDNNLAILPLSRRQYIIGRFNCYQKVKPNRYIEMQSYPPSKYFETLALHRLYSETSALLYAYHQGLIDEVIGEKTDLTVFGRMGTGEFEFNISLSDGKVFSIQIDRSQCEIDGGFEGQECFVIVEVKTGDIEDFHTRQLYFPYRAWLSKVNKKVIPVLLVYHNEKFLFNCYEFENPNDYASIKLVNQKRYKIEQPNIEEDDIKEIFKNIHMVKSKASIHLPQADAIERIIDLLGWLCIEEEGLTQYEITQRNSFSVRQTQYYTEAAEKSLKLIVRKESTDEKDKRVYYILSTLGRELIEASPKERNLGLVKAILSHPLFYKAMEYYYRNKKIPDTCDLINFLKESNFSYAETTIKRRSQSIKKWLQWIISLPSGGDMDFILEEII